MQKVRNNKEVFLINAKNYEFLVQEEGERKAEESQEG